MDQTAVTDKEDKTFGQNGSCEYNQSGVGDNLVAFFNKLVGSRPGSKVASMGGISRQNLITMMNDVITKCDKSKHKDDGFADLIVLAFQTRDRENGKGERDLAYWMLIELFNKFPFTIVSLLPMVAEYGSWKDMNRLYEILSTDKNELNKGFSEAIIQVYIDQLFGDDAVFIRDGEKAKLSLASKWVPREGSANDELAGKLAKRMFPGNQSKKLYRNLIVKLNKHLDTVEIHMANKTWADIKPGAVPARNLKIHRSAFMNEDKNGKQRKDDPDRIQCKQNFVDHLGKVAIGLAKVHGKMLQPHELVQACMHLKEDDPILEAQWKDLRDGVGSKMSLQNFVPLSDVSGSMNGLPMSVSIALGILISELTSDAFKNRILTFDTVPEWHIVNPKHSLREKVQSLMNSKWGGSTNFQAAMELILTQCIDQKVPKEDVANLKLIVLSDMQFDQANTTQTYAKPSGIKGIWTTHHEILTKSFKVAGYDNMPTIIYWNLRGDTVGFPAQANTPNVMMISGFAASLLKLLINGEDILDFKNPNPPTPWDLMRKALDDECYHQIRVKIQEVGEIKYTAPVLQIVEDGYVTL